MTTISILSVMVLRPGDGRHLEEGVRREGVMKESMMWEDIGREGVREESMRR